MSTDRIEKTIVLRAPRTRVWQALADAKAFGTWFGMRLEGTFAPGAVMRGVIAPTAVNAEVGKAQGPYAGLPCEIRIEAMEPERLFSFRWHPFAVERDVDYSAEPTTLVVFTLDETVDGTVVKVTESGFDGIPLERRVKAFAANEQGWGMMVKVLAEYVVDAPQLAV